MAVARQFRTPRPARARLTRGGKPAQLLLPIRRELGRLGDRKLSRTTGLTRNHPALTPQFEFQLGQRGDDRRHRTPRQKWRCATFAQGPQRDRGSPRSAMVRVISATDRPERVDRGNHEGVARAGVIEQGSQPGPGGRGRSGELVGEDPLRIDTGCGEKRHRG